MRKITLAIAAVAVIGFALPAVPASAEDTVVVKRDHDHDRDFRHHRHHKVVIIKHRHHHDHD